MIELIRITRIKWKAVKPNGSENISSVVNKQKHKNKTKQGNKQKYMWGYKNTYSGTQNRKSKQMK